MRFLYLMDPLEGVNPAKDTTYQFMVGAARRGHETVYVPKDGISLEDGMICFDGRRVVAQAPGGDVLFADHGEVHLTGDQVDAVFIRTDPPFDATYLMHTWLLDHLPEQVFVMNDPSGIRRVNEKVWALQFRDLVPDSVVTPRIDRLAGFLEKHLRIVVKPTDGHGGEGVFLVGKEDSNAGVIFETLTGHGRRAVIAQSYVPAAEIGDKRILLLDGEPLGALLRVHAEDDHRNNFFAGGRARAIEITARDRVIIERLAPALRALRLHFVGIDVIGEFLIEVNVTSPTCLQEMNALYGVQLEDRVNEFVEAEIISRQGGTCGN